jgi:hypothetical protein
VCGRRLRAGLDVVAGAVHEHDEVIRIADGSPRRPALRAASGASVGGAHLPVVLPRAMQPLIKQRQGDVEDQRGEDPALRGAGVGVFVLAVLGEDARLQECLHQRQHALVLHFGPHRVHNGAVRDVVEGRLDIGVQHPAVASGAEQVDLGDRVVCRRIGRNP